MFFYLNNDEHNANQLMSVRLESAKLPATMAEIENIWKKFLPAQPFKFSFLDEDLNALYEAEMVAQRVFGYFAILAIFIACIGLLGLASFVTKQRTKEIGIRKVLGASELNIVRLLSIDFLKYVAIALVFAFFYCSSSQNCLYIAPRIRLSLL